MYQQIRTYLLNNKLLIIVIILAVSSATWNWYHPQIRTLTQTEYQTVTQEKEVVKIKRIPVPGPTKIITIEKEVIVEKLGINPAPDDNSEVIANAYIPPSEGGTSVITVLNMTTGEATIIAKEKPLSLFAFISEPEAALRYGITSRGLQQAEIAARWQFLRVGHFRIGAYGEVSSQQEAKAMLEAAYRF
jgi:hypothetical protein